MSKHGKIIMFNNPKRVVVEPLKNQSANNKITSKDSAMLPLLEQTDKLIKTETIEDVDKTTNDGKQSQSQQRLQKSSRSKKQSDSKAGVPEGLPNTRNTSRVTAQELTGMMQLDNLGLNDNYFETFLPLNIGNTLFPLNTPCYLTGQKGSGKTYLLASVVQYAYKQKLISRIFYIYAESIDTTLSRAIPKNKMYAIPKQIAYTFLTKFLRKKTKFTSCYNFIESFKSLNGKYRLDEKIDNVPVYWDSLLDSISKNKRLQLLGQMVKYAERVKAKYSKGTQLTFSGKYHFNLGRFTVKDYDMIILDDIAQFPDLFGERRNKSELYPYFTTTRQGLYSFYLTGQEVKQLPKMFREMLGAIVLLNGTNLNDIDELKLDKETINFFKSEFPMLKNHEGILYNFNDKEYEIIRKND